MRYAVYIYVRSMFLLALFASVLVNVASIADAVGLTHFKISISPPFAGLLFSGISILGYYFTGIIYRILRSRVP